MTEPTDDQPEVTAAALHEVPVPDAAMHGAEPAQSHRPTTARHQRDNGDLGGLRVVIVVWCFWLLGAWAMAWVSDTSVPRVRWMLFAGLMGLMLVWPAFRLSERVGPGQMGRSAAQVLLDWLALVSVYQAVIWSLHLMAYWPLVRGLWLDAAVLAWSLLSALIVAVARLWPGGSARIVGMLVCIALVFAEPVAVWVSIVSGSGGWSMRVSPVQAMWELTGVPVTRVIAPWDRQILLIASIALGGWASLGVWALGAALMRQRHAVAGAGRLSSD